MALANEQATERLVTDIAGALEPGDLVTLSGDLGAGKTTFARAMIRYLADNPDIPVPSPTFTLIQTYDLPRFPVVHADLYRLEGPGELAELGFDDLPKDAVVLLEWPDRAAGFLPPDRLDVAFTLNPQAGPEARKARITAYGAFAARAERIPAVRRFLDSTGYGQAERRRIQGDASTRSYERLKQGEQRDHPDELAAPAGRTAGARRQALQRRSRIWPRTSCPLSPWRTGSASAASRRRRSTRPSFPTACSSSRTLARTGGVRRSAGADRAALYRGGRRADRAAQPEAAERDTGGAACRPLAAALRHRRLSDRGRAAARLVSAAARHHGDGRDPRRLRRAVDRIAPGGDRGRTDLGAARFSFAQSALAARAHRASPASACSTSRTP